MSRCRLCLVLLSTSFIAACGSDYIDEVHQATPWSDAAVQQDADGGTSEEPADYRCDPLETSESLPARTSVMSERGKSAPTGVYTSDLFELFNAQCGGCHVNADQGGWKVASVSEFPAKITADVLARIKSNDPEFYMPPADANGKPFSQRAPEESLVSLANQLEAWIAAGKPKDVFYPASGGGAGGAGLALNRKLGMAMTNLGTCVPSTALVHDALTSDSGKELDEMFAKLTTNEELPKRLEQTDLVSMDTELLARQGVVPFAPAYTLWADNAKKQRMIRVPRGESIKFDKNAQTFAIPDNTRFYKTFFKKVIDHRGNPSYRKMETRLIVARADEVKAGCEPKHRALFGTYIWNEAETEAILLTDPLRNGKPFRDRLITFLTDEHEAEAVLAEGGDDLQQELLDRKFARTYAVPGSERCIHCHMGSQSFILGFTPLQIRRRPENEGGVIEPALRDELNQLQRFIDYGLVTGMTAPEDVTFLEDSQGDRKPRNNHELTAQGYMLGNCAHCHNPRGFPSRTAPELEKVLNFLPEPAREGQEGGGIFQFPIAKVSPRIQRGNNLDRKIPYISPSLTENANADGDMTYYPMWTHDDPVSMRCKRAHGCPRIEAPWRSLIYRNVDTPFSYSYDSVIFPHMPMDTPGYDHRARQLLGSWMVSIPARFKYETECRILKRGKDADPVAGTPATPDEYLTFNERRSVYPDETEDKEFLECLDEVTGEFVPATVETKAAITADPQPFVEVPPGDPAYGLAVNAAQNRVWSWEASSRYLDYPDPTLDIRDPDVGINGVFTPRSPTTNNIANTWPLLDSSGKPEILDDGELAGTYEVNTPARSHWVISDLTQVPGPWTPRRTDWEKALTDPVLPDKEAEISARWERNVRRVLPSIKITPQFEEFALKERPFTTWLVKPECDFSQQPTLAQLAGADRPLWADARKPGEDAPLYSISPGAFVFGQVCSNCHGPLADSRGRMAANVADVTGGTTIVANLRDGLFGAGGIDRVFGEAAGGGLSAQDWASRYLVWMGLGGTRATIPDAVLGLIGAGKVIDQDRQSLARSNTEAVDANMLAVPRRLCERLLTYSSGNQDNLVPVKIESDKQQAERALIRTNGDAEMWLNLCSFDNPLPILVVTPRFEVSENGQTKKLKFDYADKVGGVDAFRFYPAGDYPADAPVNRGELGAPWCLQTPEDEEIAQALEAYLTQGNLQPARCPSGFVKSAPSNAWRWTVTDDDYGSAAGGLKDVERWSLRGAVNAGLAVYAYLSALQSGEASPPVAYDRCESLSNDNGGPGSGANMCE